MSTGSWELISNMPTPQYNHLVAVLPTNEMIVVGGCTQFKTDAVYSHNKDKHCCVIH